MKKDKKSFSKKITRKHAIKKMGVTALTATTIMFLSTKANASASDPTPPGW